MEGLCASTSRIRIVRHVYLLHWLNSRPGNLNANLSTYLSEKLSDIQVAGSGFATRFEGPKKSLDTTPEQDCCSVCYVSGFVFEARATGGVLLAFTMDLKSSHFFTLSDAGGGFFFLEWKTDELGAILSREFITNTLYFGCLLISCFNSSKLFVFDSFR